MMSESAGLSLCSLFIVKAAAHINKIMEIDAISFFFIPFGAPGILSVDHRSELSHQKSGCYDFDSVADQEREDT